MEGREGTRAKYSADLFARSSPLLLLRLMSSPSTPSPAAHPIARLCQRSGRGTGCHLVRFWAMQSPPHRHTLPPIDKQPAAGQRLDCLPSCPPRPLPLPSGGDGRAEQTSKRNRKREPGRRMLPTSSPVPLFCLLPSPSTPSPVLPFRLRLRFLLFFALISSARSHLFALPSSCSSFLALLPAD